MNDLAGLVRASVDKHRDLTALEVNGIAVSYGELWAHAGKLRHGLARVAGRAQRVGLYASRSQVAYAGYLAILRAGAAVVPINPAFPEARNLAVAQRAGIDAIIADREVPQSIADIAPITVAASDAEGDDAEPGRDAYVLFTSGSTGVPKGVPIEHRNVVPYLDHAIDRFELGPGCRLSQNFELTFDPSVFDLFAAWGSGAAVIAASPRDLLSPIAYAEKARLSHWFSVPSVITYARRMGMLQPSALPKLRYSTFIGEPLTQAQAAMWRESAPNSSIDNVYGPTELTIHCTEYRLPADVSDWPSTSNGTVPIGQCVPGIESVIVGAGGCLDSQGELCFRGVQRFAGYLDPADNQRRFYDIGAAGVAVDFASTTGLLSDECWYRTGDSVRMEQGHLVHAGRIDRQIKMRGYRLELGDVEAVVRALPEISGVAVVHVADRLCCFYTGLPRPPRELRRLLAQAVPDYMIPSDFRQLDSLPLNGSGKTDYAKLTTAGLDGPVA